MQDGRYTLPLIDVTAIATTPRGSMRLAVRSAKAFETYLTDQQRLNKVPTIDRVVVQQVQVPRRAEIFRPRSKTMPIVIFMAVMFATVGLAFLLENVRPPARPGESELAREDTSQRRSA